MPRTSREVALKRSQIQRIAHITHKAVVAVSGNQKIDQYATLAALGIQTQAQISALKRQITGSLKEQGFLQPQLQTMLRLKASTTITETVEMTLSAFTLSAEPPDYHCTGPHEHEFSQAQAKKHKFLCPHDGERIVSE